MKIFLSAVSSQFKACRDALRSDLSAVGAKVVVQEDLQQHGGSLMEKLERSIASCDRLIALVGDAYGCEPEETTRPTGQPRRSYTQWEYCFARGERLDGSRQPPKDIYLYIGSPEFLGMHPVWQGAEEAQLQHEFIQELARSGKDRNQFGLLHELRALVLRDGFRLQTRERQPRNLPYTSLGCLFKGREHILPELEKRLERNPGRALTIYGPAGVGKTRLTIEYALRHEAQYMALLAVGASSRETLQRSLAALCGAEILNLSQRGMKEQEVQVAAALGWLSQHSGWLLILDNADTREASEAVEELLPNLRDGQVMITSRLSDWSGSVEPFELEILSEEAAVEFLLERTKSRRLNHTSDGDQARELAKELDGLALGLEQAGAFISKMRCSFGDYLQRRRAREEKVRTWHDARLMHYPLSMAVTWDTSFEQLAWAALDLLNLLCWLAPEPVPRALTAVVKLEGRKQDASSETPAGDGDLEEALAELAGFSMLKWETGNQTFRIHRLVQEAIRERLTDEQRSAILESALWMVNSYLPRDPPPNDVRSWPILEPMVAHVGELVSEAVKAGIGRPTSRLASMLGIFAAEKSLWFEAEVFARLALEIDEQIFEADHPNVAVDLGILAQLLQATNRLSEAEPLMKRALEIDEKTYGPVHPKVAIRLNNLAALLEATNRLPEAEPLMTRALEIDEKSYGPAHPVVANRLNNLAALLQATNRLSKAESLMRRALEIDEKSYGPAHPVVAKDLNNLAGLLQATNRLSEAEPMIWLALEIDEKSYGSAHPNVAIGLNNLAQLLKATNQFSDAEPLMRRALEIDEKSYGPAHPKVATRLNNLAGLLHATDRLSEAEPLMRRALEIDEKSYGPAHPMVAIKLNNLAQLLQTTNRFSEAEPLMRRGLEIEKESYGPKHWRVAVQLNNLAQLLQATDRLSEAEPLMRGALEIDEKSYGLAHPKVATRLNNLAQLLQTTNRLSEAEDLSARCVVIYLKFTRLTGYLHPNLRAAFGNYLALTAAMALSEAETGERIWAFGIEAGFDHEGYCRALEEVL
jgi:tetratricopeptide (TPR) repeat protein